MQFIHNIEEAWGSRISYFLFQRFLPEMSADIMSAALNTFLTIFKNKLLVYFYEPVTVFK